MRVVKDKGFVVIYPPERIDISNSTDLRTEFLILIAEGYKHIILDFSQVKSIDSSGLGKLLYFQEQLSSRNGKLTIRNVASSYIHELFQMIYLDHVIDVEMGDVNEDSVT